MLLTGAWHGPRAGSVGPFDPGGAPATRVAVTWADSPPERIFEQSHMANRLLGVAAVLGPVESRSLAIASRNAAEVGWPAETEVLGYVHVSRGGETSTFRVGVTPDRLTLFADVEGGPVYAIPSDACRSIIGPLGTYAGDLTADSQIPLAEVTPLPGPYRHSPVLLDAPTIRDRLAGGRESNLPETDRFLPDERLFVRLPAGYTPREPAGLLVWVNAGPGGDPPEVFDDAADAMGLVMIGAADSGNVRLSTDRYQLALDAVATAAGRFHIDPTRVYVTGISGGGRISSALVACFPDVFTGAVPIVGVNTYKPVPLGDGSFVIAGYGRPDAARWRLLRKHRIAAMSGPLDFNYREIVSAVRILQRDGLDARLFEYEDMAHTLPTAERFAEAIGWVEAPHAAASAEAWADAAEQLETYLARFDELPVRSDAQRRLLERIAVTGPWSPAAWRACELLGITEAPPAPIPGATGDTPETRGSPSPGSP